ncbi:protein of unknown function [Shewanella benthica]|uniref:Uncharacterized protein n=1 Tax=Shewanella benthica TaxID=43661 RepID=A0A330LZH3_9GAMM|nr:protein of unknown function [Shewanella benthica]
MNDNHYHSNSKENSLDEINYIFRLGFDFNVCVVDFVKRLDEVNNRAIDNDGSI